LLTSCSVQAADELSEELKASICSLLMNARENQRNITLDVPNSGEREGETKVSNAVKAIAKKTEQSRGITSRLDGAQGDPCQLPKKVRFPYSRQASLREQRHLVEAFRPKDIWPCTVSRNDWLANGQENGSFVWRGVENWLTVRRYFHSPALREALLRNDLRPRL
jgi:DNA cross-link repair 1C protein